MDWIITLIVVYGFIRLIMFLSKDGSEKPKVSAKSQVPTTPKEPPRRITIDDLAREYDEVFEWADSDEIVSYFVKWDERTFVVRGHISMHLTTNNPRVETYALDIKGEHKKQYVSLSLESWSVPLLKKSNRGPFHADFLFPVNTSIDTLISKGCTEVIVQGTFSGIMTLSWMSMDVRERLGIGGVTAIFTDCKIVREL